MVCVVVKGMEKAKETGLKGCKREEKKAPACALPCERQEP